MKVILKNTSLVFAGYEERERVSIGSVFNYTTSSAEVKTTFNAAALTDIPFVAGKADIIVTCGTASKAPLMESATFTILVRTPTDLISEVTASYGEKALITLPSKENMYHIQVIAPVSGVGEAIINIELFQ